MSIKDSTLEDSNVSSELSVRLVVADHYMSRPLPGLDLVYSEFRGADIKQVPVLRIFGPTLDGRKACVHVHGVFPYFYIPCGIADPEPQLLYQIAASLDKALNISLKQANSTNQHVYRITLVKGLPFYGFHYKEHLFFKVFLYNPNLIKQAVELLNNAAVLGQVFQPYEAHLNFTLQFFIDFNLFGMSNVDLQTVRYRRKGAGEMSSSGDLFSNSNESNKPESMCYYEADALASHIINRQRIGKGDGIENPGLEEVWNKEKEQRRKLNISIASKSLTQERGSHETDSHFRFENMFWMKISDLSEKPVDTLPSKEPIYYPAESLEGSQLYNAYDVSMHQPCESLLVSSSESFRNYMDETVVDENAALNCSISDHYSQVLLDSEDIDFIQLLKDLDHPVDNDSILGTQVEAIENIDDNDDAEYSQVFNDTTLIESDCATVESEHLPKNSEEAETENDKKWDDTFWDNANIPQLDGTCDDDHTKKVRKRKMPRTRSLGLPHPRPKNKVLLPRSQELQNVSNLHNTFPNTTLCKEVQNNSNKCIDSNTFDSYKDNVAKSSFKKNDELPMNKAYKLESKKGEVSAAYDIKHNFEPTAGPSKSQSLVMSNKFDAERHSPEFIDCSISSDSSDKGIISFYDRSKLFDVSSEMSVCITSDSDETTDNVRVKTEKGSPNKSQLNNSTCIRLHASSSTIKTISSETQQFQDNGKITVIAPKFRPPTRNDIESTLHLHNLLPFNNKKPFYSNYKDVGNKIEVGQIILKLSSKAVHHQKPFSNIDGHTGIEEWRKYLFMENNDITQDTIDADVLKNLLAGNKKCILEPVNKPPSSQQVKEWLASIHEKECQKDENLALDRVEINKALDELDDSQVIGLNAENVNESITVQSNADFESDIDNLNQSLQVCMQPDGSFLCYGGSIKQNETHSIDSPSVEMDFLTIMAIEVHTETRGDLNPDPQFDKIMAVFVTVTNDSPPDHFLPRNFTEAFIVDTSCNLLDKCGLTLKTSYAKTEEAVIEQIIQSVRKWDPDILTGYEIELNSWGYLLERSEILGIELQAEISRITEKNRQRKWKTDDNNYEGRILGRVVLNVWRMFRHELALSSYSFENTMYHVLKERVPTYSPAQRSLWWTHEVCSFRWISVEYYLTRLSGTMKMLEKLDMINRTSELARLFGMQWWEVLSRGSQFRVESLMLRAARPLNLIALSPSVRQRAAMKAPECLPLIFEPESRFYTDPVIVLDFQSLYPSMMIAYNYCFSTCIGRVQNINGEHSYEFGAWRLRIPKSKLETLVKNGLVHWSPVGVGFVSPQVRRGVLPSLLRRILAARQAVKKTMKLQTDESVKKAMHSRQLGLKLIANVTYGYTAANFSGRMPCVEVGDSVVSKGRETLERAIRLVENNAKWNVKVVYGDTDSMFVLVPGGTRERAFQVGREIADAVTADNPAPVALKLEKVYQPCILQTKKRYVGYMYESADQKTAVYEAKGIETVRRDGCPAAVKLLQRSLCTLFETYDLSAVKSLVLNTLSDLTDGRMPLHELFFTREYHGATGYRPGAVAPPLEIARRLAAADRRSVPRAGERVSWLVAAGAPGLPLVRLARSPGELHAAPALRPHVAYYVSRVMLPPLDRCLALVGADVFAWYRSMAVRPESGVGAIVQYMWRCRCLACDTRTTGAICRSCSNVRSRTVAVVANKLHTEAMLVANADMVCRSCCGHRYFESCRNYECPLLWRRQTAQIRLQQTKESIQKLPECFSCNDFDF